MGTEIESLSTRGALASLGIPGLDDILGGGFTPHRLYLVEGVPGSGKTTLALQFLMEGVRCGEKVLYVTLSETEEELRATATSHGWSLDGMDIHELAATEEGLDGEEPYTMFHPAEVELNKTTHLILSEVERLRPSRVVFDSLSEIRLLSGSPLRYRRQILALKRYFAGRSCTVMLLDDLTASDRDLQVQSIAHGVINLQQLHPEYGSQRRRLNVQKLRGTPFRGGYHDYVIVKGGLRVFPRLVAAEHRQPIHDDRLPSGILEMDRLLGGGVELGTSTLIVGPPGTGKSTLASQFIGTATAGGRRAAMFCFDESLHTLIGRARGLGIDLTSPMEKGLLKIQPIDPAELSPGEFAYRIRQAVEDDGATLVVIDSLNGYMNAMPAENYLAVQLHEMLSYLGQKSVATLMIAAHSGLIGSDMRAPIDATYLADAAILLRYFETEGEVRQAISIIKKRGGEHERSIREFRLERGQIRVGEPLKHFRGILTGVPQFLGGDKKVMENPSS